MVALFYVSFFDLTATTGQSVKVNIGLYCRWCFNCASCREQLTANTYAEDEGEFFCEACYNGRFSLDRPTNKWVLQASGVDDEAEA
jgi:formylmethanofuran dehydrogenase subunit E